MEYSVNLASLLRTHVNISDNSSPWLTFLIDWGGVNILWYNILTPPPPPPPPLKLIFKNGILTMEYSVNLASLLRTCKYHRQL